MNWIASPDDFVRRVEEYVKDEYRNVAVTGPHPGLYGFQMTGLGGIVSLQIHPGHPVTVSFIPSSPGSTHEKPAEKFPYTEASLKPIAQTICSWIEARRNEGVRIMDRG
jgi:hypothetical protein